MIPIRKKRKVIPLLGYINDYLAVNNYQLNQPPCSNTQQIIQVPDPNREIELEEEDEFY